MGCGASKEAQSAVAPPAPAASSSPAAAPTTIKAADKNQLNEFTAPLSNGNHPSPMVVDLNDVVPLSGAPGHGGGPRARFLSYASGASTPNSSTGDLSSNWDETGLNDVESDHCPTKPKTNPKTFSRKNSGSAIGLDDIQSDSTGLKVVHIEVPFGKPIEEVYDGVNDGMVLGSGVSGLVRLVKHKATGVEYAVKCLDLGLVGTKEGLAQLREEIFIMCQLDHPNIVRLEEVYESHSEIYLVQELCLGGELFDRLDEQPDYHYTEGECARLVKQMLSAVRYLHSKGIIHRDLKLENFLFSSKDKDSELKMIDFGLSKHFQFGEVHHEAVGTPYTVAPEVIRGSYDERCDIWAIGVISFLLLSGDPPFGGCGGPEPLLTVRSNILAGKFAFEPEDIWCLVSQQAKDFVKTLLVMDPQMRPLARQAQKHPWLKGWASRQSKANDTVLNPNVVKALVNFKEFSDMRKLLSEVLSFTLLPDQIKELRKEFEIMDTDGSGEISLESFKQVLMANAGAGSLGALKEEEIEDIFNAMRVNKKETRIHWHEFIAAGLSQCQVDDRNLRLAFDRLDSDHKGYITLDDIMYLVGNDELHSELQIREMWKESMRSVNCTQAHITYENFLLLMKGQTKKPDPLTGPCVLVSTPSVRGGLSLVVVPEGAQVEEEEEVTSPDMPIAQEAKPKSPSLAVHIGGEESTVASLLERNNDGIDGSLHSLPNMGGTTGMYESSSSDIQLKSPSTSLESPESKKTIEDIKVTDAIAVPVLRRGRSKSLADEADGESSSEFSASFRGDSRRALALPEKDHKMDAELAKNKSALAVNRQLYRAHRQMRQSVLDASRRFEEQQARRARDVLTAQQEEADGLMGLGQAGLVMRHGHKVHVTSEAIRKYLEESKAEQQQLVDKANRRGGRGRSTRKKTISDMSAMMNPSMGQDELGDIATQIANMAQTPEVKKPISFFGNLDAPGLPSLTSFEGVPVSPGLQRRPKKRESAPVAMLGQPPTVVDQSTLRKATVPGEFRKTQDPFSSDGMYGGARVCEIDVKRISGPLTPQGIRKMNSITEGSGSK